MGTRTRSVLGWFRRLGKSGTPQVQPRRRPGRSASVLESLERREVLSSASLFPWVPLPVQVTPISTPTIVTPTVAVATSATTNASAAALGSTTLPVPPAQYLAYVAPQANSSAVVITPVTPAAVSTAAYYYGQPVVQAPAVSQVSALANPVPAGQPVIASPFVTTPANDPATQYIQSLYHDVLGRTGDPTEVAAWLLEMDSGMTPAVVAAGFVNSVEHRQDQVDYDYETLLHRAPDAIAEDWVNALLGGASEESVEEGILDSPEYQTTHQDPAQFIEGLYSDVLGREGKPTEIAAWQEVLATGVSRQTVVADFVGSTEAVDEAIDRFYVDYLDRQPDAQGAGIWSEVLNSPTGSASQMEIGILSSPEYVLRSAQS